MDDIHASALYKNAACTTILDILFFIIAVALFWDNGGDSEIIFAIIVISCLIYGIKMLYILQCFQQYKRDDIRWNRSVEYTPLLFTGLTSIGLALILFIVILRANGIEFFEAFAHLDLTICWLIAGLVTIWVVSLILSMQMSYIHRRNSTIIYEEEEYEPSKKAVYVNNNQHSYFQSV